MQAPVDALATSYTESAAAGQDFLRQRWRSLDQRTQDWLTGTKHYKQGQRLEPTERLDEIESLEYDLGVLHRCVRVRLPARGGATTSVAIGGMSEALHEEVLDAAASMMYGIRSNEPAFLRLGLEAIRQHQMAWLLTRLPRRAMDTSPGLWPVLAVLLAIFALVLVFAAPALVAIAITAASRGDESGAMFALYGLGVVYLTARAAKSFNPDKMTVDEEAYFGWLNLNSYGPWLVAGPGAAAYLSNMMGKGAKVPPVAVDLCAMLTCRMVSPKTD